MVETVQAQETITQEIHTAVRQSAVYGLGNVLAKALGFLMLPLYTHYLSPVDYGVLEILDLSMSLFGMFLAMGITPAVLRCYAGAKTAEDKRKTVSTAFLFVGVTGLVTFAIMLGLVRPVSTMIFGPAVPASYLLVAFASFILGFVATLPRTYLRALEASGTFISVDTGSLFLMMMLNIVFIAVLKIGLLGILLSSLIVAGLQVVLLSIWTLRKVGLGFSASLLRQMLLFGFPLMFSNLSLFTLNFADRFFLQHFRSLETVGVYAVGYKFGYMMNYLLVQPFLVMWQSRMYAIHTQPDHPEIFGRMFVLYALVLTYAGLALSMLSPEIVHLMVDPKFSASQNVIPVVALAYIFYGISYYVQVGMFITNRTNLIGMIGTGAAVLNLALNYFLILHYGMMGAAWATLLSFLAIAAASYWFSNRVYPLPLSVGRVAMTMSLGVCLYLLSRWMNPESVSVGLLFKGLLLAAFPILLWRIRILSMAEMGVIISTKDSALAAVSRLIGRRATAL